MADEEKTAVLGRSVTASPVKDALPTVDPANYEFLEVIAAGGMGRIRAAIDNRLGREVAIKELLPMADVEATMRFEREAIVSARLQHPSIISVYEAGRWPNGSPFLAMRLVRGSSLKDAITDARTFDARLALLPHLLAVANAMAYAHDRRIIHRDLKPANIVVGAFGETVVIDWGLAKDLDSNEPDSGKVEPKDGGLTRAGAVMGTPSHMAPEQAMGKPADERTDVYQVGAILYHLLSGEPPYSGDSEAILSVIVSQAPEPIEAVAPGTPVELAEIMSKAMARNPRDRYPSARELAEDLRRFLSGQLVAAHRYTRGELVRRFVRSHRGQIALAALALGCLGVVAAYAAMRLYRERDEAQHARAIAESVGAGAEAARVRAVTDRDAALVTSASLSLGRNPVEALESIADLSAGTKQLAAARQIASEARDLRIPRMVNMRFGDIVALAAARDGTLIATDDGNRVLLWDTRTWKNRELGSHDDRVERIVLSPDDRSLASLSADGGVRVWEIDGKERARATIAGATVLAFSGDGKRVVVAGQSGVQVLDGETVTDRPATRAAFAGDAVVYEAGGALVIGTVTLARSVRAWAVAGSRVAFVDGDQVAVWDAGKVTPIGREPDTIAITIARDGRVFTYAAAQRRLGVWKAGVQELLPFTGVTAVRSLALASADEMLVVIGTDSIALCDLRDGTATRLFAANDVADFALTAADLVVARRSRVLRWSLTGGPRVIDTLEHPRFAGYLRDGRLVTSNERRIAIGTTTVEIPSGIVGRVAIAPDDSRIAALGADGIVYVVNTETHATGTLSGKVDLPVPDPRATISRAARQARGWFDPVMFSSIGIVVAGATTLHVWRDDKQSSTSLGAPIVDFAVTPSQTIVVATRDKKLHAIVDGVVRVLDAAANVQRIAAAGNGAVATAGFDGRVRTWNLTTGESHEVLRHHTDFDAIAFSADAKHLASGDENGHAIFGSAPGYDPDPFSRFAYPILTVTSSVDSTQFGVATTSGAYLVDVTNHQARSLHIDGAVGMFAFAHDGSRFTVIGDSRFAHEWPDDLPRDEIGLRKWIAAATDMVRL